MPRQHSTLPRAFVTAPLAADAMVTLDEDHTNHLVNVRRLEVGEKAVLFNGRDGAWVAALSKAHKKAALFQVEAQIEAQPPANDLWFGFAPLKVGRLDYLVQKATEMGAGVIQPVITDFTQMRRLREDKLNAWVLEAAEQCEVLNVPVVAPEMELRAVMAGWTAQHGDRRLIWADESAPSGTPARVLAALDGARVGLLVGPEGGFSDAERDLLRAQDFVVPISLGPRILRADTAAVAALTVIQSIIGDWR